LFVNGFISALTFIASPTRATTFHTRVCGASLSIVLCNEDVYSPHTQKTEK